MSKPLYEEVIDEIGTQTLARVGLNIFSIDTFNGYGESVKGTNNIFYQADKRKGNLTPKRKENDTDEAYQKKLDNGVSTFRGYMFESIDESMQNISSALFGKRRKTYTTDTIADIRTVAGMIKDDKKYENLTQKDRAKFDIVKQNYDDELNSILSGTDHFGSFSKHDMNTDLVTYDSNGKIVKKEQHKVIKNTNDLLKQRYLDENDSIKVPFDDYKRHRKNLEDMINSNKTSPEKKEAAKIALEKLDKSNYANKLMCESPKATAILTQSVVAGGHITQAGLSDATVIALSTLASGTIYEIKDMFSKNGEKISITDRLRRLINKVIEDFKNNFKRGAGFGVIDTIIGVLSQIFKSISSKILTIWKNLRNSAKSIYNAIYSYAKGDIKTYKDLIMAIVKALFSFTTVIASVGLEANLETLLSPIMGVVASFVAPVLAIIVGAFAVVMGTKMIESSINYLFGIYVELQKSRAHRAEIEAIIDEFLPQLIEDNKQLKNLIDNKFESMKITLDSSFRDFKSSISSQNSELFISSLVSINSVYGMKLKYLSFSEFDEIMLSDKAIKF